MPSPTFEWQGKTYSRDIRIVFSDIDGTLLRPDHELSAYTCDMLRQLPEHGIEFALATGRMPLGVYHLIDKIGIPTHLICLGGSLVRTKDSKTLVSETLSYEAAKAVIDTAHELWPEIVPSFFAGDDWFTSKLDAPCVKREIDVVKARSAEHDLYDLLERGILPHKLYFNCTQDRERCIVFADALSQASNEIEVIRSLTGTHVEVMPLHVSKAKGAQVLLEHLHMTWDDACSFGDDNNDLPMLQKAKLGVALGNAAQPVKEKACAQTLSTKEDGLALFLDALLHS
ncbi:MAG: HAD family hydrolase [Coriobacteriales bacterium]|nr:HAD family hydrolase [Coriobacteriales bacterium]